MLFEYLKDTYSPGELIIASDIDIGLSDNNRRQQFKVLVDSGKLIRVENGIYCIPKESRLGGTFIPSAENIASARYIQRKSDVFGYYSGYVFANRLGLTTQMPFVYEIVSNEMTSPVKKIIIAEREFVIRKPRTTIDKKNVNVLQLLDLLKDIDLYCEVPADERNRIIADYIKSSGISEAVFDKYLPLFPDKIYRNIYEMRITNVFAQ